jgi:CheY-like chemotaxis protein
VGPAFGSERNSGAGEHRPSRRCDGRCRRRVLCHRVAWSASAVCVGRGVTTAWRGSFIKVAQSGCLPRTLGCCYAEVSAESVRAGVCLGCWPSHGDGRPAPRRPSVGVCPGVMTARWMSFSPCVVAGRRRFPEPSYVTSPSGQAHAGEGRIDQQRVGAHNGIAGRRRIGGRPPRGLRRRAGAHTGRGGRPGRARRGPRHPPGVRLAAKHRPGVLLLDADLPGGNPVTTSAAVRAASPATKVLLLAAQIRHSMVAALIASGAEGLVTRDACGQQVIDAIYAAVTGSRVIVMGANHRSSAGTLLSSGCGWGRCQVVSVRFLACWRGPGRPGVSPTTGKWRRAPSGSCTEPAGQARCALQLEAVAFAFQYGMVAVNGGATWNSHRA